MIVLRNVAYLKDYATRKESVVQDSSQRRANIVTGNNHLDLVSDDFSPKLDSESFEPFLQGIEDNADIASLRSINFLMDASKKDNNLSIAKDAWKLLIQVYGKEIKKFIDARKLLETQLRSNKTPDSSPNQSSTFHYSIHRK